MTHVFLKIALFTFVFGGIASSAFSENLWFDDVDDLQRGLNIPFRDRVELIYPTKKLLTERTENSYKRNDNEIPSFTFEIDPEGIQDLVVSIAKSGKEKALLEYLKKQMVSSPKKKKIRIELNNELLNILDLNALSKKFFSHTHHHIEVNSEDLREDLGMTDDFLTQVRPFMNRVDVISLAKKMETQNYVDFDSDVLPPFARKAVKTFTHFKGPNCFHAVLAFQDPLIPKNHLLHPSRYKDYNWQMMNYDELWRVLSEGFYEVDAEHSELKFGDILVFFDKPPSESQSVDYRWIKHATVYLFDEFTFSKGSKSANTSYTVNTLEEEFTKWRGLVHNLAIKIFRKSLIRVKNLPYADQHDWLF